MGSCQSKKDHKVNVVIPDPENPKPTIQNGPKVAKAGNEDDPTPTIGDDKPLESPFFSPVIGILSQPDDDKSTSPDQTLISSSYARLIEGEGGRAVPIKFDMPRDELDNLMSNLNGVIFCGGHTHLNDKNQKEPEELSKLSPYGDTIKYIVEKAVVMTDAGNPFPLWGICLGMQSILVVTDLRNKTLESLKTNGEYLSSVGQFQNGANESRLYLNLPENLKTMVQQTDLEMLYYDHKFGIKEKIFNESESITKMFKLLSVNKDNVGTPFVTSYEGIKYPFRGTQYHPEKIQFEWKVKANRRPEAVEFSQFLATKFVDDCKQNKNQMSEKVFQKNCIHNYPTAKHGKYSQVYLI